MSGPHVVLSAAAVAHLAELVGAQLDLQHLDPTSPTTWPALRRAAIDGALERLQAEAELGDERSAATWEALVRAGYDLEFAGIAAGLEGGQPEEPTP